MKSHLMHRSYCTFLFCFLFLSIYAQKKQDSTYIRKNSITFPRSNKYYLDNQDNLIKLNSLDQKLKFVLNNEFSKLVTGNSSSGLGNYASFSTVENTFSASLNFIKKNGIFDINISGETSEGITNVFSGGNFNTGININAVYHCYIGKPIIEFDQSIISKIELRHYELSKKKVLEKEKIKAKLFALNNKLKEKNEELIKIKKLIVDNSLNSELYKNNQLKKLILIQEIKNNLIKIKYYESEANLKVLINVLRKKRDDPNNKDPFKEQQFKVDSLKVFNYKFTYNTAIKSKQEQLLKIETYLRNVNNNSIHQTYKSQLELIKKEISIINDEIKVYQNVPSTLVGISGLLIQEEINTNLKKINEVKAKNINITWFTFGGGIGYDSYDLFDETRTFDKQIFSKEDVTPSFSFAISKYTNQSLFKSKKIGARKASFLSFGIDVKLGNNIISDFTAKEVVTSQEINTMRTLVTKKEVLLGTFKDNIVAAQLYLDYYKFLGNKDNIGIHLKGIKNISDLNSTSAFRIGALIPFVNKDDKSSFLNLEVFYSINDIFKTSASDSPLRKNILGIQTTLPFNFKIL